MLKYFVMIISVFIFSPYSIYGDDFTCNEKPHKLEAALNAQIGMHAQSSYRIIEGKFTTGFVNYGPAREEDAYFWGLPDSERAITFNVLKNYLINLRLTARRNAAIIFYAFNEENQDLVVWLITSDGFVCENNQIRGRHYRGKRKNLTLSGYSHFEKSAFLLPEKISTKIKQDKIDTLIFVPCEGFGRIQFANLNFNGETLVESCSIFISPGFYTIYQGIYGAINFTAMQPVIVGYGLKHADYSFEARPIATETAQEIALSLGVIAIVDNLANKETVIGAIEKGAGFIFIFTHGVGNSIDPLDGSFLLLADGAWTAKEISKLRPLKNRPVVVMSACKTGSGKDFEVGIVGLTRAWKWAGASQIVMSSENVEVTATKEIMTKFIDYLKAMPADKALQSAMKDMRKKYKDPKYWANFAVFGMP